MTEFLYKPFGDNDDNESFSFFFALTSPRVVTSTSPLAWAAGPRQFPAYLSLTSHWVALTFVVCCVYLQLPSGQDNLFLVDSLDLNQEFLTNLLLTYCTDYLL